MSARIITACALAVAIVATAANVALVNSASHREPQVFATASAPACPGGAARCITVPYRSGPFGKGSAGTGLVITGSRGMGGCALRADDYTGAPEVWICDGALYVAVKRGMLGAGFCLDIALRRNICLSVREFEWLKRHAG